MNMVGCFQVWERCVHLLSCSEPLVRLTALKTLSEAAPVLSTYQGMQ